MSIISKLLTNKYLLYVVLGITLLNMFVYLLAQDTQSIALYVLFYFVIRHFSKNMIIVLLGSLLLVNFINMSNIRIFEGNTTMESSAASTTDAGPNSVTPSTPDVKPHEEKKTINGKKDALGSLSNAAPANGLPSVNPEELIKQQEQLKQLVDGMLPIVEKMEPMMRLADKLGGFLGKN